MLHKDDATSSLIYNLLLTLTLPRPPPSKQAGVTKSCTVRLDDKIYCVRDGGEWKECPSGPGVNDLVVEIEKLYRSS